MPRIDETNPETINRLNRANRRHLVELVKGGYSIDVCGVCYELFGFMDEVEHPPYSDMSPGIDCDICGQPLTEVDEHA